MLEANKGQIVPHVEPNFVALGGSPEPDALGYAMVFVRRQIWVIILFTLVGMGLGTALLLNAKPNFAATATLLIDTRKIAILQQPSMFSQMSLESSAAMDSQVEILKSEKIALAVIEKLRLWEDPEFVRAGSGLKAALFGGLFAPEQSLTDAELVARAREILAKRLTASRIGNTYAIEIGFESKSADRAAQVANTVADAYITEQLASQYNGTRQASDWLATRVQELRGQTDAAQRAVIEYKRQNNIVETSDGQSVNNGRLAELNAQLNTLHDKANEAKVRFDQVDMVVSANAPDAIISASIGDAAENEVANKLRAQYRELAYREAEWSAKYGRDHLAVVELRKQMLQLRAEIQDEFQHLRESRRSEYEIAKLREAEVKKELAEAVSQSETSNRAQVALTQLEASARTDQEMYDSLLKGYTASLQEQTSPVAEASVITRANPPSARNYKKSIIVAALFPIVGLALGLGVALLRELRTRVFWTSRPIESSLHTTCLGIIPKVKAPKKFATPPQASRSSAFEAKNIVRGDNGISWTVVDETFSRFSESVRSIKLAVDLDRKARTNKVIGFTSTLPNEGKTTIAMAFGQQIARTGARIVVVDCDLRNPSLTRSIAPGATRGIVELISGEVTLDEILWKDQSTQMEFIPAVLKSERADSYSILASNGMRRVFDDLRARYEFVVVDLSPLAPIIDVCATTHLVDLYILVIEWGRTKIDIVEHALRNAPEIYDSMLGAVLNKADIRRLANYDSRLAGYYYNKQYRRYGYADS